MPRQDPRVDAIIAKAAPFAQPILKTLRATVHEACPEVVENIKWGMPSFEYRGRMMAGMAAFKAHAVFGLWQGERLLGESSKNDQAMGDLGRITSVKDLPPKRAMIALIKRAMKLNEQGITRMVRKPSGPRKPLRVPRDLAAALAANPKAAMHFDAFPPSHRREYIEWITEAKREATRERRLEQAVAWIAGGKHRNWKYEG